MGKVIFIFIFLLQSMASESNSLQKCLVCHKNSAPPFAMVYRRYLMLYSSKFEIKKRMVDFLIAPSRNKSSMPEGMMIRFYPENHPIYSYDEVNKSVDEVINREDIIQKITF